MFVVLAASLVASALGQAAAPAGAPESYLAELAQVCERFWLSGAARAPQDLVACSQPASHCKTPDIYLSAHSALLSSRRPTSGHFPG